MLLSGGSLLACRSATCGARRRAARSAALGVQLQDGSLLFSFGDTSPTPPPPPRPPSPPPPSAAPAVSPPVPLASAAVAAVAPELSSAFQPAAPSHPFISAAPPRPYAEWLPPHALQCSESASAPLRVAVLLSGGVDSALALNACCAAGHAVTAFYLQIWFQEDFRNSWDACPWEEDLEYARAVCEQAGVPLEVVPLTKEYWERVVGFCVGEIGAGRTPNPDVLCNSRIKFGAFLDHLSSLPARFDRVASGHYARVQRLALPDGSAIATLHSCSDADKDQTYFLGALSAAQLSRAMFPLGGLRKKEVRELAAAGRLPPAGRKDSQGICFLGKVKFSEFVESHLGKCGGSLVELECGERLGSHSGVWFHTLGQRSGIKLSGGPWYVAAKDPRRNLVYVSRAYHGEEAAARRAAFRCGSFSWLGDARPLAGRGTGLRCKVRHGAASYACRLQWEFPWEAEAAAAAEAAEADARYARVKPKAFDPPPKHAQSGTGVVAAAAATGLSARVWLEGSDQGLAAGQFAVFYTAEGQCLGSAVILGSVPQ